MTNDKEKKESLIAQIVEWAKEKPDCEWLQKAVSQLKPQEISNEN